jgi:hypothetical protein
MTPGVISSIAEFSFRRGRFSRSPSACLLVDALGRIGLCGTFDAPFV